jgi:hypothetical protein
MSKGKGKSLLYALHVTIIYWYTLINYIFFHKKYSECQTFPNDLWAKVQLYSLSLIFYLWNKKHYRSKSYQQDMIDNLKNVAIPGTGIPLHLFAYNWWICLLFILIGNPIICFFGAWNKICSTPRHSSDSESNSNRKMKIQRSWKIQFDLVCEEYVEHLLHPQDWFSFWRLNCRLVSYHSLLTHSIDYEMEDKWTFLIEGERCGAAVSPFFTELETLVVKNKNIEGGMGIHFFTNAAQGGDWIIQEKMKNADWLTKILPENPPLSTMRIITSSTWSLHQQQEQLSKSTSSTSTLAERENLANCRKYITALSSVLRLGRANAATDHSSVLFDVNLESGVIQGGMSNAHWYRLGLKNIFTCPWLPTDVRVAYDQLKEQERFDSLSLLSLLLSVSLESESSSTSSLSSKELKKISSPSVASGHAISHPDLPNVIITGQTVPDMDKAVDVVLK